MAHWSGMFFGYREGLLPGAGGRVQLPLPELPGRIPHAYEVFTGDAGDSYGDVQVFADQSEILLLQIWDQAALFQISRDGVTVQDELELDPDKKLGSWLHRMSARGYRVKNKAAGRTARFQVIPFR